MSPETFNSPSKNIIRSKWNKELIKFISENLGSKLVYLGLPSPEAEDILEWVDYINEVIAFQCREYNDPSDASQSRNEIIRLENKLDELERQQKIDNFMVYDGYMEEVLTNGKDNMDIDFIQNDIIHIYNLDFCNSIQYPREVLNSQGNIIEVHKFDVLKNLLEQQANQEKEVKKFILFLTINSSFKLVELSKYIKNHSDKVIKKYLKSVNKNKALTAKEKNIRFLKTCILDSLNNYFFDSGFIIEILPTIRYEGVKNHKMLHFTVLGTKTDNNDLLEKGIKDFLSNKFIAIEDNHFVNLLLSHLSEEADNLTCPVECFKQTETYNNLW